jgi:hypothetical protein
MYLYLDVKKVISMEKCIFRDKKGSSLASTMIYPLTDSSMSSDVPRDGILEHQFNKSLESFSPCYSQYLLQYWRILKKTIFFSGFKNPLICKKPAIQENSSLIFSSVEKQTKTRV